MKWLAVLAYWLTASTAIAMLPVDFWTAAGLSFLVNAFGAWVILGSNS